MSQEKVVAVYDTLAHAEAAVSTLKSAGYFASDISVASAERGASPKWGRGDAGYWGRLFGRPIRLHERKEYGPIMPPGGVVVTVRVPESEALSVVKLLKGDEPIDVMDRGHRHDSTARTGSPRVFVPPPNSYGGEEK